MIVRYQVRFIFEVVLTTNHGLASVENVFPFLKKTSCPQYESTHKISCNKYFYVWGETKDEAKQVAKKEFECFVKEENIKLTRGYLMAISEDTIINDTNGHNKDLVNKINYIWARVYEDRFKPILLALYERDKIEAEEKEITFDLFNSSFESFAYEFMMHVCDDVDLEVIIDFIRFREDTRVLYHDGWV